MYTRDGEYQWIRDEAALVREPDGSAAVLAGDHVRRHGRASRARSGSRESEARYGALVDQLPAIVYSEDLTGDGLALIFINERVEHLLGSAARSGSATPRSGSSRSTPRTARAVEAENARVGGDRASRSRPSTG